MSGQSLAKTKEYRMKRLQWLLDQGDVIMLERRGPHCFRLIHYDWPQSQYIDYWPRAGFFKHKDGRRDKGWIRLMKAFGLSHIKWAKVAKDFG